MPSLFPTMHVMRWVAAFIAVVVSGLFGNHFGAQRERETVLDELLQQESNLAAVEQHYQAQIAQLRTQRDIADASNLSLQKTLKQMQNQSLDIQSSLQLYDNIEGNNRSSGLGVDTVTLVNGDNGTVTELHITVVQARGRDRVKGQIGVALIGEKDDKSWREVIVDAEADSAPRFDMRFFQTLVVPLPELDAHVDIVEIEVIPGGNRHKPSSHAVDWSSILED